MEITRKTILMLPYGHILCHVVRLLEIAKELRLIGYEIIFAGEGKYMQLPKGEGFEVVSTKEADHERLMAAVRKNKIRFICQFTKFSSCISPDFYFLNVKSRIFRSL